MTIAFLFVALFVLMFIGIPVAISWVCPGP